ncbi:MAG: macrolide ABC transporter ATP-binding protein, partial [Candidatus Latescibacteria bacterium]|nr:macrolide ABC transporter ATP-binding protein [Candidatus Latescibacterota bacterium]
MADTQTQEERVAALAEASTVVRTQDVKKVYVMGDEEVHALKGVDLE